MEYYLQFRNCRGGNLQILTNHFLWHLKRRSAASFPTNRFLFIFALCSISIFAPDDKNLAEVDRRNKSLIDAINEVYHNPKSITAKQQFYFALETANIET